MVVPRVQVEGMREFQRAVSKAVDRDLPKRIGQVNKQIGQHVISRLRPAPSPSAVGAGRGAAVRASATRREVILRAGGGHRSSSSSQITKMRQWGARPVDLFRRRPKRPHVIGTSEDEQATIVRMLRDGYLGALRPPFR